MKTLRRVTLLTLGLYIALACIGCASKTYQVHPGAGGYVSGPATAAQLFDSQSYDTLSATDAIIEQTRADFLANKYPANIAPTIHNAFNSLVAVYNNAQSAWLALDAALKAGQPASQAALQAALTSLQTTTNQLLAAKGGK